MDERPVETVFVIDDDPAFCESMRWLVESVGKCIETYSTAEEFLQHYDAGRVGCLVADVRLPDMSGLELLEELVNRRSNIPVILISGYADVPMAVRAMKAGALDFLEKPWNNQVLLERIQRAIKLNYEIRNQQEEIERVSKLFKDLTPRETEVFHLVVQGNLNKQVASALGISQRTVEIHRANVMRKLGADGLSDLVRISILLENNNTPPMLAMRAAIIE